MAGQPEQVRHSEVTLAPSDPQFWSIPELIRYALSGIHFNKDSRQAFRKFEEELFSQGASVDQVVSNKVLALKWYKRTKNTGFICGLPFLKQPVPEDQVENLFSDLEKTDNFFQDARKYFPSISSTPKVSFEEFRDLAADHLAGLYLQSPKGMDFPKDLSLLTAAAREAPREEFKKYLADRSSWPTVQDEKAYHRLFMVLKSSESAKEYLAKLQPFRTMIIDHPTEDWSTYRAPYSPGGFRAAEEVPLIYSLCLQTPEEMDLILESWKGIDLDQFLQDMSKSTESPSNLLEYNSFFHWIVDKSNSLVVSARNNPTEANVGIVADQDLLRRLAITFVEPVWQAKSRDLKWEFASHKDVYDVTTLGYGDTNNTSELKNIDGTKFDWDNYSLVRRYWRIFANSHYTQIERSIQKVELPTDSSVVKTWQAGKVLADKLNQLLAEDQYQEVFKVPARWEIIEVDDTEREPLERRYTGTGKVLYGDVGNPLDGEEIIVYHKKDVLHTLEWTDHTFSFTKPNLVPFSEYLENPDGFLADIAKNEVIKS